MRRRIRFNTRLASGLGVVALLFIGSMGEVHAQGHRVSSNQVIIETQRQWENWGFAFGTLQIEGGEVSPSVMRRNTNAVFDIVDFLKLNPPNGLNKDSQDIVLADAITGGSNAADVVNLLDGDMSTYWQPDVPEEGSDLASQWWFTVDLGRFVFTKKLVLKFVDEEMGDPFLLFDVLVSDGLAPPRVPGSKTPRYHTVLRTLRENKDQRFFEIDLQNVSPEAESDGIRFVQVVVNGTAAGRGRLVTQEEYEALSASERGEIEHNKLLINGGEVPVRQDVYEQLETPRRGQIRYFRQERPRLAELEVWGLGDEILSGTIVRGGFISATEGGVALNPFVDGDRGTNSSMVWDVAAGRTQIFDRELFFDLGSFFWIDTHRMAYGGQFNKFGDYLLQFSDGSRAPDGTLQWTTAFEREQAGRARENFEGNIFAPVQARFFRMSWTVKEVRNAKTELAEIQLYGEGVQPQVVLESDLIRLGGSRNLLSIAWDADLQSGTQVIVQTRTGNELGEVLHYYKKDGSEVTESQYGKLLSLFKGDIVPEEVAGNDWSGWSEPYAVPAGSAITSPSPREFLKVRVTLTSEDSQAAAALRSIRLNFVDPVAQGLVGEVVPFQVDSLGIVQPFSLYIRPDFDRQDSGFDELLLVSPPDMVLEYVGLFGGSEADLLAGGNDINALTVADAKVVAGGGDSLRVAFSAIDPNTGIDVLRLDFRTTLFSTGAVLRPSLQQRGATTSTWQRVDAGNAIALGEGNTTTLVGAAGNKDLIRDATVRPAAFSPNGDGINDEAAFEFKVVRVGDASPAEVLLYDLSGRLVRRLLEERKISTGVHVLRWDGRDHSGEVVPPGIYYARLRVATETDGAGVSSSEVLHTVSVAY